ncbi:MAG TPA: universal stress protein [Flavisolibacter sp.]|jgi:nucleotide-binding universal stress UspA family protein|nr:universal stress protein [Flavisolibacter sp.]
MNTIIVPTDFSPAADNATEYAAQLAGRLNSSVLLLHVYQLPVPMTDYPVLMVTSEDLKKGADEGLNRALETAQKKYPEVSFQMESRLGDVATEIEDASKERNAFALVVGTKDLSGFERFLFGDTTISLIKNSSFPVIGVPESSKVGVPQNMVLATDFTNVDDIPTRTITGIAGVLGANLHVVHVEEKESKYYPEELMQSFTGINASYHAIKDDDVAEGLKHYVEQNNIDLVLVLPHKHNLYERLFFKGHTKGILHAMPVPVMSLRNE